MKEQINLDIFPLIVNAIYNTKLESKKIQYKGKLTVVYYKKLDLNTNIKLEQNPTLPDLVLFALKKIITYFNNNDIIYEIYKYENDINNSFFMIDISPLLESLFIQFYPFYKNIKSNFNKIIYEFCVGDVINNLKMFNKTNIPSLFIYQHYMDILNTYEHCFNHIVKSSNSIQFIQNTIKKEFNQNRQCLFHNCSNIPQKSHIIPASIIKNISGADNFVFFNNFNTDILDLKSNYYTNLKYFNEFCSTNKKTNNNNSYPLFCNTHDSIKLKNNGTFIDFESNEYFFDIKNELHYNFHIGSVIEQRLILSFLFNHNSNIEKYNKIEQHIEIHHIKKNMHKKITYCDHIVNIIHNKKQENNSQISFYIELDFVIPLSCITIHPNSDFFSTPPFLNISDHNIINFSNISKQGYTITGIFPKKESTVFYFSVCNITNIDVNIMQNLFYDILNKKTNIDHISFLKDFLINSFLGVGYFFFAKHYFDSFSFFNRNIFANLLNIKYGIENENIIFLKDNLKFYPNIHPDSLNYNNYFYKRMIFNFFIEKITPLFPQKIKYIHHSIKCIKKRES